MFWESTFISTIFSLRCLISYEKKLQKKRDRRLSHHFLLKSSFFLIKIIVNHHKKLSFLLISWHHLVVKLPQNSNNKKKKINFYDYIVAWFRSRELLVMSQTRYHFSTTIDNIKIIVVVLRDDGSVTWTHAPGGSRFLIYLVNHFDIPPLNKFLLYIGFCP